MEEGQSNNKQSKSKFNVKKSVLPWLLLIIVLVAGVAGTLYYKDRAEKVEADPASVQQEKNQAETDRVLTKLKRVLNVSETDAPTVARVEDPEKLKQSNQDFYKDIQVGDYLVIYPKRAIIFRESASQIINIAPIINTSELQAAQGTTPAETSEDDEDSDNNSSNR